MVEEARKRPRLLSEEMESIEGVLKNCSGCDTLLADLFGKFCKTYLARVAAGNMAEDEKSDSTTQECLEGDNGGKLVFFQTTPPSGKQV